MHSTDAHHPIHIHVFMCVYIDCACTYVYISYLFPITYVCVEPSILIERKYRSTHQCIGIVTFTSTPYIYIDIYLYIYIVKHVG